MSDEEHFEPTIENKKGVFEKATSYQYRKNCKGCGNGYHDGMWQAHHILPGVTVKGATIRSQINDDPKADYIENCKWITDWDLNEKPNLIGLPTIWDYLLAEKIENAQQAGGNEPVPLSPYRKGRISKLSKFLSTIFGAPKDLPAHNPVSWGHTDYNDEVKSYLKLNVWNPLDAKKEEHKINPESIKGQLDNAAKRFLGVLKKRGKRPKGPNGGTKKNWPKRFEQGNTTWFQPFSMAKKPENPL